MYWQARGIHKWNTHLCILSFPFVYTSFVYWKMEAYQIVTPQLLLALTKLPGNIGGKQLNPSSTINVNNHVVQVNTTSNVSGSGISFYPKKSTVSNGNMTKSYSNGEIDSLPFSTNDNVTGTNLILKPSIQTKKITRKLQTFSGFSTGRSLVKFCLLRLDKTEKSAIFEVLLKSLYISQREYRSQCVITPFFHCIPWNPTIKLQLEDNRNNPFSC